jgi:hypothetical protein
MATSFISERSAEYILAPKLAGILGKYFSRVIPLFFWSTREGSNISLSCHPLQTVRIINVFARRPKITTPNQPSIEVKFNNSILKAAQFSSSLDIPTFAGVPLASSILDLTLEVDCAWFELTGIEEDVFYNISLDGKILSRSLETSAIEGVLEEEELAARAMQKSYSMKWSAAIENLRTIRRNPTFEDDGGWLWFRNCYRPFHLLLFD